MKIILPLLCVSLGYSSTIQVPPDYSTIQEAINAALPGDSILVYSGVYQEVIDFSGKPIALVSVSGPEVTCIQSVSSPGEPVVSITGVEGSGTVLEGFSITGGSSIKGGGVRIIDSSPLIVNNIIYGNQAYNAYNAYGGGIYIQDSSPVIVGNHIYDNMAMSFDPTWRFAYGGGIYAESSELLLLNNRIEQNYIDLGSACEGYGSGVYLNDCTGQVSNNVIAANYSESASADGVGIYAPGCDLVNNTIFGNDGLGIKYAASVVNCIVWANNLAGTQLETVGPVTYSDVMYGYPGEGNITLLPGFAPGPLSDFQLDSASSPCIDSGNPDPVYNDPEGSSGMAQWPAYGSLVNDMGAYGGPGAAYWLEGYTTVQNSSIAVPGVLTLHGALTNPVRSAATIAFTTAGESLVEIAVFDSAGREVFRESSVCSPGYHTVTPGVLPPGLYLSRIHSSGEVGTAKFVVIP